MTHQWYREVKRNRNIPKLAVRIKIPDGERVLIGKYTEEHIEVSASEAVKMVRQHNEPGGLEVIIPRSIKPSEIIKIYKPHKVVGWRYYPDAHGRKPCGCIYCQRGEPNSRRLQDAYDPERLSKRKSDKKINKQKWREMVKLLTELLEGQVSLTEGCRNVVILAGDLLDVSELFACLEQYDENTSDFPLGDEREYWSETALERADQERKVIEERNRERLIERCAELVTYAQKHEL